MPRGRKKKIDFNLETAIDVESSIKELGDDQDTADVVSDVIVIDKYGRYGLRTYKYGYELVTRDQYNSDTEYEVVNKRTKETRVENYKKGDYTEWRLSPYAFHGTLDRLFTRAAQLMVKDGLDCHKDIEKLPQILKEVEERIIKNCEVKNV